MSNSSLVNYTRISPNRSVPRNQKISKITVHHMAGNLSVETCGNVFAPSSRQASSNYGIGSDGRVGMYVEEKDRAWTSSSSWNDNRAVTIEVANDQIGGNWHVSNAAWNKLVELCVDICKRNGMTSLTWTGNKNGSLTCHYMFASTNCPGPYLTSRMPELAKTVTARLNGSSSGSTGSGSASTPSNSNKEYTGTGFGGTYRCNASDLNVRTAPTTSAPVVAQYKSGQTVNLDDWYTIANGYVWGRYTGASSGQKRYVAVGKATGKPETDDYLIKVSSGSGSSSASKSVDTLAREVIAGKWGNGDTRKQKLEAAGYDYDAVQKRVNQLL